MSQNYKYGDSKRIICFEDKDDTYARMVIKLRHENLSKAELLRAFALAFIEDNPLIDEFVVEYKKQKEFFNKKRQNILDKEKREGKDIMKKFGFDPDEIEDLFDLIEEESDLI